MKKNKIFSVAVFLLFMFSSIVFVVPNVKATYQSYGYVSDDVTDSWEFDTEEGRLETPNSLVRLGSSEYYLTSACGDTGSDTDGLLRILKVWNDNGTIQKSLVDKWTYDTDGAYAGITHISDDVYAIIYWDFGSSIGKVFTTTVWSSNGTLKKDVIDTFNLTYACYWYPSLIHVTGDVYAAVYQEYEGGFDHQIETIEIDTSGVITNTRLDIQEFDSTSASNWVASCNAVMVDSDTIAIVWQTTAGYNWLCTYTISGAGIITDTPADSWQYVGVTTSVYSTPFIYHISGNIFAISYIDVNSHGWTKTVTIANTGAITKSWIDTLGWELDGATSMLFMFAVHGNQNIYGITYRYLYNTGSICTMKITDDGFMELNRIDVLYIDWNDYYYLPCVYVDNAYYFTLFEDTDNDGQARTFEIYMFNLPPELYASPYNTTAINLNWEKPFDADTTYVEYMNQSEYDESGEWGMGEGHFLYNDTGTNILHEGLEPDANYIYEAWSYNATNNVFSDDHGFNSATTLAEIYMGEDPENESTGIDLQPTCSLYVESTLTDTFDITWQENSTGTWVTRQTNYSVVNGTYYWDFTQATEISTKYYWRVFVDTGLTNFSRWYFFTTASIYYPIDEDNQTYITQMNTCTQQGRNCTLYVAYVINVDGTNYFQLASSTNNGTTWSTHSFLDTYSTLSSQTSFMIDANGTMHFAWVDEYEDYGIFYSRSYDNGITWTNPTVIAEVTTPYGVTGCIDYYGNIHFFYGDYDGNDFICHIVSIDDGDNWNGDSPDTVAYDLDPSYFFTVDTDFDGEDSYLYVVFQNQGEDGEGDLEFTYSINNGTDWSSIVLVNDSIFGWVDETYHIAVDSSHTIHLVGSIYNETDYYQLVYTRSFDHGETWDALANLTDMVEFEFFTTDISVDINDIIYISYVDEDYYISYFNSSDGGDSFYDEPVSTVLFTDFYVDGINAWWSNYPETCDVKTNVPNTGLFLVFRDDDAGYLYATFTDDFSMNCGCFPAAPIPPPPTWYPIDEDNETRFTDMNTCIQQGRNCTLYAIYLIGEGGSFQLASSSDNGTTWSIHSFLDGYFASYIQTSFMIDANGTMHFAWSFTGEDTYLFYSRSYDGGDTWSEPIALETIDYDIYSVTGCIDYYGNIHLFYYYYDEGGFYAINHIVSTDGGDTWNNDEPDVVVQGSDAFPLNEFFTVASDYDSGDSYLYIVFSVYDNMLNYDVVNISSSVDNGTTWSEPVCINESVYEWDTDAFHITIDSFHTIHFIGETWAYMDELYTPTLVYTRSFDHGTTWDSLAELIPPDPELWYDECWISVDSNDVVYIEYKYIDYYLYYFSSSDGGDSFYESPEPIVLFDDFDVNYFNVWWSNYPENCMKTNVPATGLFLIFNDDNDDYLYDAFTDDFSYYCFGTCPPTAPDAPTNLTATTISSSRINLAWTMGSGATHTRIQRKTGGYPTSINDGTNVYNSTGSSCSSTGLTASTKYYYRAWSWDSVNGLWSITYAGAYNTTLNSTGDGNGDGNGGGGGTTNPPPGPGTGWPSPYLWGLDMMLLIAVIILLVVLIGSLVGIRRYAVRIRRCR